MRGGTAVFTIIAKNYLAQARVLMASLAEHHPEWRRFAILADRADGYFDPKAVDFEIVPSADLPIADSPWFHFKYTLLELSTAVKPYAFEYLFATHGFERIVYLDPDIRVYSPLTLVAEALESADIVMTPHLMRPAAEVPTPLEIDILRVGAYNLGFIAVAHTPGSSGFLAWWGRRLYEHCLVDKERGFFVDQKWMDLVPGLFSRVSILRDPGYNLAYWNLHHWIVGRTESGYTAGTSQLSFFHFSGYDAAHPDRLTRYQPHRVEALPGPVQDIVSGYRKEVLAAGYLMCRQWPYAFASFQNGTPIPDAGRQVYRDTPGLASRIADPFSAEGCERIGGLWSPPELPVEIIVPEVAEVTAGDNAITAQAPPPPQGVVVLGMHRAGTSLTAAIVAQWGAHGSDVSLQPADANNAAGYWEYPPLVSFNEELLRAVDSSWNVPPRDSDKPLLEALSRSSEFRDRATQLLEQASREGEWWFWKDPRLSVLLPFWKAIWSSVVYVVAVRDPTEIAASLNARDGFSTPSSFTLWERYMTEILGDSEVLSKACFVRYDRLVANAPEECERLCDFLGGRFGVAAAESERRLKAMVSAIRPELHRSRGVPFLEHPLASEAQRLLYIQAFRNCDEVTVEPAALHMDPAWRQRLELADQRLQPNNFRNRFQVYWRGSNQSYDERRSALALIAPEDTAQSLAVRLPPGDTGEKSFVRVDFSQQPGLVELLKMSFEDPAGELVWSWSRHPECIRNLPCNAIQILRSSQPLHGCLLQLDSIDSWIEIALDPEQARALTNGGRVAVTCAYVSQQSALLHVQAGFAADLDGLRKNIGLVGQTCAAVAENDRGVVRRLMEEHHHMAAMLTSDDITRGELERRLEEQQEILEGLLNSRTWRFLTASGGLLLQVASLPGLLRTRLKERLQRPRDRDNGASVL